MVSCANQTITPAFVTAALRVLRPTRRAVYTSNRFISMKGGPDTRVAAITGASGGIGEQTAIGLIRTLPNLSKLFLCCRNTAKGDRVAQLLRDGLPAGRNINVTVVPVELSDTSSIVSCASVIEGVLDGESLDLLICNAGIMASPFSFTSNGGEFGKVESQFAVNHLSHALLTHLLLPALRRDGGRVIFVSSLAVSISRSRTVAPLLREKIEGVVTEANYAKWKSYGDSKLAMSLYAKALAERENYVESVSLHPGVVQTELVRHLVPQNMVPMMNSGGSPGLLSRFFSWFGLKTAPQGAELSIELAKIAEGGFENGDMYVGTGLKKAARFAIPLIEKPEEVDRVYEDVQEYIRTIQGIEVTGAGVSYP